jgi:tRNA threonylcarbamoyladenosine biosynthesis protein TsaB
MRDDCIRFDRTWDAGRRHSVEVAEVVESALSSSGMPAETLDGVVVGTGPGSYTGIRVGIALAKGLALAAGCPLVGVSSLEAVAHTLAGSDERIYAVADLGRGYVGLAVFEGVHADGRLRRIAEDRAMTVAESSQLVPSGALICGWGRRLLRNGISDTSGPDSQASSCQTPRAAVLAEIGRLYLEAGSIDQRRSLQPNYLRPSSAEERAQAAEAPPEIRS